MEHDKTSSKKPDKNKNFCPSLNHVTTQKSIEISLLVSNKKENILLIQMCIVIYLMSYVLHIDESCIPYEMSFMLHMDGSYTPHLFALMSYVLHIDEPYTPHKMRFVLYMNVFCIP